MEEAARRVVTRVLQVKVEKTEARIVVEPAHAGLIKMIEER